MGNDFPHHHKIIVEVRLMEEEETELEIILAQLDSPVEEKSLKGDMLLTEYLDDILMGTRGIVMNMELDDKYTWTEEK